MELVHMVVGGKSKRKKKSLFSSRLFISATAHLTPPHRTELQFLFFIEGVSLHSCEYRMLGRVRALCNVGNLLVVLAALPLP